MAFRQSSAGATRAGATSPSQDRHSLVGTVSSAVAHTKCLQVALSELKEHEGRLIYAEHRLRQEYSRIYDQIEYIKNIVQHSVVLVPEAYDRLVEDAEYGRAARRAAAAAYAGGAGSGTADAAAAAYAGGAGSGTADAAAHTCVRRSLWNAGCAACKRDFDAGSVSVEDSE
jgi:hypothetical protein